MGKVSGNRKRGWFFVIPALIIGSCAAIYYTDVYTQADQKIFELLDYIVPPPKSDRKIIHIEMDRPYPAPDEIADGLIALGELGSRFVAVAADFGEIGSDSTDTAYLGGALEVMGNAYVPVYGIPDEKAVSFAPAELTASEVSFLEDSLVLDNMEEKEEFPFSLYGLYPSAFTLLAGARGGGFLYSDTDSLKDLRQIPLFRQYRGAYYLHLVFAGLIGWFEDPAVFLYADRAVLRNANIPGREMKDIVIPFSESGNMYIRNVPVTTVKFSGFIEQNRAMAALYSIIAVLERDGRLTEETGGINILKVYRSARDRIVEIAAGESAGEGLQEIKALRERFVREAGNFFLGDAEEAITAVIYEKLQSEDLSETEKSALELQLAQIEDLFTEGRSLHKQITDKREELRKAVENGYCIFTFQETPKTVVEMYAALLHTVISEVFIDDFPWWYSLAGAFVLSMLFMFILTRLKPVPAVLLGLPMGVVFAGLPLVSFYFFSLYVPLFFPAAAAALTYFSGIIVQVSVFTRKRRDLMIRFSKTVPASRLVDLQRMPFRENTMEGIKLPMSILSVRIADQASSILESTPDNLLSMYTAFSRVVRNSILELEGLVGSIDGDKAWGVWGAFSEDTSDALEACKAGFMIRKRFKEEYPLVSLYFSITSGKAVRGKNITPENTSIPVAGIPVAQAEKFLDANGLFGTEIVMTEKTHNEVGTNYVFRRLDRVKIEGISESPRLYELIAPPDEIGEKMKKFLDLYSRGHELFEKRDWIGAHKAFIESLKVREDDKAAKLYARRCQKFVKDPPSASWDGTFTLS